MLPTIALFRKRIQAVITDKDRQGHVVAGLIDRLNALPDSYDALHAFARQLARLPLRPDWPYLEPNDLEEIWAECDPKRPTGPIAPSIRTRRRPRVEAAFLAQRLRLHPGQAAGGQPDAGRDPQGGGAVGEWPLRRLHLPKMLDAAAAQARVVDGVRRARRIQYVAPDDDINYTVMGMLLLEQHGLGFTQDDICRHLAANCLPMYACWGPERTLLLKAAACRTLEDARDGRLRGVGERAQPGGRALRRADPRGCLRLRLPGQPGAGGRTCLARRQLDATAAPASTARCSWRRRSPPPWWRDDPLEIFETALQFVPQRSRFYANGRRTRSRWSARRATGWRLRRDPRASTPSTATAGSTRRVGTLINTLRFADRRRRRHLQAGQPGQRHGQLRLHVRLDPGRVLRAGPPGDALAGPVPR